MAGEPTWLWEIAGLTLSVAQMVFHYNALDKYRDRLETMAGELTTSAGSDKGHYLSFRSSDPAFYNYYKGQPEYSQCTSNVLRSKGSAFARYSRDIRRRQRAVRGFAPLSKVMIANQYGQVPVGMSASKRAVTHMEEQQRVDDFVIHKWHTIVNAPVGVERHQTAILNNIIQSSFKSMSLHGQAFNAAGVSLGNYLYRILD